MIISGLNHTARSLAVYASQRRVTPAPRKTRFRLLARLCRAGLVTRRVPTKGFRVTSLPPFPSFPGALNRIPSTRYGVESRMPLNDDTSDLRQKLTHAEAVIAELHSVVARLRKQI